MWLDIPSDATLEKTFFQQLSVAIFFLAADGIMAFPFPLTRMFSALNMSRSRVSYHNRYKFLCISFLLCLGGAVPM